MKKYVASSSNSFRSWIVSKEVDALMKDMDAREKRLVGKIMNSSDPNIYVAGLVDAMDIFQVDCTDAFDAFMQEFVERSSVSASTVLGSASRTIDSVKFAKNLADELNRRLPDSCYAEVNFQYDEISIDNSVSKKKLTEATVDSLEYLGYDVFYLSDLPDSDGYDIVAVDENNSFAKLVIDTGEWFGEDFNGYIDIQYGSGDASLQDWYAE